jgi:hypothetical protein
MDILADSPFLECSMSAEPGSDKSFSTTGAVVLAWLPVTLPLLWGIWQTVKKAAILFR